MLDSLWWYCCALAAIYRPLTSTSTYHHFNNSFNAAVSLLFVFENRGDFCTELTCPHNGRSHI